MFGREKYPSYETHAEKAKKAAKAAGSIALAASVAAGAFALAYEGSNGTISSRSAPIERMMKQYPNVVNQSAEVGDSQIIAAGEWEKSHPEVKRVVIEEVDDNYGHDTNGDAAEKATSTLKLIYKDGKFTEVTGIGEQNYTGTGSDLIDKKLTHLEDRLGMSGGNAAVEDSAKTQAIEDALSNTGVEQSTVK